VEIYLLNISFDFEYLPLLIVVAIAWFVPMLLSVLRLQRIPAVIVEIVVGFFIGRYLLMKETKKYFDEMKKLKNS